MLQRERMMWWKVLWELFEWYSVCWGNLTSSTCDLMQCVWLYLKQMIKHSHIILPGECVQNVVATSVDTTKSWKGFLSVTLLEWVVTGIHNYVSLTAFFFLDLLIFLLQKRPLSLGNCSTYLSIPPFYRYYTNITSHSLNETFLLNLLRENLI